MCYDFYFSQLMRSRRTEMTDDPKPSTQADGLRVQRRSRREMRLARRERCFSLLTSGYSFSQIAKMMQANAATVRREIDRALAERRLEAPERFAQVQVARLIKALRLAEAAIELGEMKAIATYLKVVAALDRYHELAAGPPPRPSVKAPPLALPTPPKALTYDPPPGDDRRPPVEEAKPEADEVC
jgi:DNA-binding CsgD family transcriptional regulator